MAILIIGAVMVAWEVHTIKRAERLRIAGEETRVMHRKLPEKTYLYTMGAQHEDLKYSYPEYQEKLRERLFLHGIDIDKPYLRKTLQDESILFTQTLIESNSNV